MNKLKYPLCVAAMLIMANGVISCKETTKKETILTKEVQFTKEGELTLKKAETDSLVANLDIEIADDEYQTQTGLMYRSSMSGNQAMLFVFDDEIPRSFYMKNTQFPLDIIYLNSAKEIVSIQKDAKPLDESSLPSEEAAKYVLEVNAGLSEKWKLEKGDLMEFDKSN